MRRCALRLMQMDASEFLRRTAVICLEVELPRIWSLDSFLGSKRPSQIAMRLHGMQPVSVCGHAQS